MRYGAIFGVPTAFLGQCQSGTNISKMPGFVGSVAVPAQGFTG